MKTYIEFEKESAQGNFKNVYFVLASDNYFIDKAASLLREKLFGSSDNRQNYFLRYADDTSLEELAELSSNFASLFSEIKLIVLKKCEKYSRKLSELFEFVSKDIPDSVLLLCFDKDYIFEKKLEKKYEFYDFSRLPDKDLYNWVRNEFGSFGRKINDDAIEYFLTANNNSFDILHKEIEKICSYDTDSSVQIDKNLILKFTGFDYDFTPDDLMKAILRNDSVKAVRVLDNLLNKAGLNEIYLVSIISNYYFDLLCFKSGKFKGADNYSLFGKYKLWGNRLDFAKQYHNLLNIKNLEKAIALLLDLDKKLKTSMLDSKIMLTSLIEELSSM